MELPLKYAYTVWEKQSFSMAAKLLFVSQPSLSATIAKLESDIGFKIFDRSTHPISLTAKGKVYINYLKEISEAESLLTQQLKATDDMSNGSLRIGGYMSALYSILPVTCNQFAKKYPNVSITVDADLTAEQLKNRTIDLHFAFSPQVQEYTGIPLLEERLIIVVGKNHPSAERLAEYAITFEEMITQGIAPEREISDLSLFFNIPFIKAGRESDSDNRLSMIMRNHKVSPYIVTHVRSFDMRYRMMQEGLGAIFASDLFLSNFPQDRDNVYYFALRNPISFRTLYVQHRNHPRDHVLLDEFVETLLEVCQNRKALFQRRLLRS